MWENKYWFDDLTESQARISIILFLLIAGVLIFTCRKNIVTTFNPYEQNKEWLERDFKKQYSGIVLRKGRNKRNSTFIQFKDSTKIFEDEEKIWNRIEVGDSVNKKQNFTFVTIIRKDTVFLINYIDVYNYRDSLIRVGEY